MGAGGRETSGYLEGITTNGGTWRHQPLTFAVVRAGITEMQFFPRPEVSRGARPGAMRRRVDGPSGATIGLFGSSAQAEFMAAGNARQQTGRGKGRSTKPYAEHLPYGEVPYGWHDQYGSQAPYPTRLRPYSFEPPYGGVE
jgi:hypothetical protein